MASSSDTRTPRQPGADAGWESFWQRTGESSALAGRGPQEDVLSRFWAAFLDEALATGPRNRLIDLACGNGAVARQAVEHVRSHEASLAVFAADRSIAAMEALRQRVPAVRGVACDAGRLPFADRTFDLAVSQFGIEYAGTAAFSEVARIVTPGGIFAAVLHLEGGAMYRENAANLEAARAVDEAGILPGLKALFEADARVRTGKGSRAAVRSADAALEAAMGRVGEALGRLGAGVAGGMVQRLHGDVGHMRKRVQFHDAAQVGGWCDLMAGELHAYAGRMASMLDAAVDAARLETILELLRAEGFSTRLREASSLGRASGEPAAWLVVSERR